jgi:hypothetical protein
VARRLGFDHNPLRRRLDVIEAWLLPAVIAVFLAFGPLLVGGADAWAHARNAAVQQDQRSWHQVPAVLLQAVPGPVMSDNGANSWTTWTPARWTSGGRPHAGLVPATSGTSAGSTVPVWLDGAGHVRVPPLTAGQVRDRVTLAALVALTVLVVILAGLALVGRRLLDRRRLAGWETAWLSVGPHWSRRA